MRKLGVVLLNWNGRHLTYQCARTIPEAAASLSYELVIVDNGSVDESVDFLREHVPSAYIVQNRTNIGFARGTNIGIRAALGRQCTHVAIINNDATVAPMSLEKACDILDGEPDIGLLGAKMIAPESGKVWFAGARINRILARATAIGAGASDDGRWDTAADVDGITLAFAVARAPIFEHVGLIPEEYFFGQEEWDYSLKVKRAGYRLRYEPSLVVMHGGDGSHKNSDPKYIYCGYRNKLIFQWRNLPRLLFYFWAFIFGMYGVLIMPWIVPRLHQEPPSRQVLRRCAWYAVRDHFVLGPRVEEWQLDGLASRLPA